jgi:uncharacterized protein GlcG (DUF336 family)
VSFSKAEQKMALVGDTDAMNSLFRTKIGLTLELAKLLAKAAEVEAISNNWPVAISIFDDGGNLILLHCMDGTQIGSISVAQSKGITAVRFKRPTKVFEDIINTSGKTNYIQLPGSTPIEGGLPLMVDGQCIGGIGISGVTSAQDGQVAAAAVARLEEVCKARK